MASWPSARHMNPNKCTKPNFRHNHNHNHNHVCLDLSPGAQELLLGRLSHSERFRQARLVLRRPGDLHLPHLRSPELESCQMSLSILHRHSTTARPCNSQELSCMDARWTICTTTTGKQYDTFDTPLELYHLLSRDPRWIDNMHNRQKIPQNGRTLDICPRPHFSISIHRCTPRSRNLHSRPEYSTNTMHSLSRV